MAVGINITSNKAVSVEWLSLYSLFLAKAATLVVVVAAVVLLVVGLRQRQGNSGGELLLTDLGEQYRTMQRSMRSARLQGAALKQWRRLQKKVAKAEEKQRKSEARGGLLAAEKPCVYVLDFTGSMDAREVGSLRGRSARYWRLPVRRIVYCCAWKVRGRGARLWPGCLAVKASASGRGAPDGGGR